MYATAHVSFFRPTFTGIRRTLFSFISFHTTFDQFHSIDIRPQHAHKPSTKKTITKSKLWRITTTTNMHTQELIQMKMCGSWKAMSVVAAEAANSAIVNSKSSKRHGIRCGWADATLLAGHKQMRTSNHQTLWNIKRKFIERNSKRAWWQSSS